MAAAGEGGSGLGGSGWAATEQQQQHVGWPRMPTACWLPPRQAAIAFHRPARELRDAALAPRVAYRVARPPLCAINANQNGLESILMRAPSHARMHLHRHDGAA